MAVTRGIGLLGAAAAALGLLAISGATETGIRSTPIPFARKARLRRSVQPRATTIAVDVDPPEVQVGERLFLETRFAQYFASHSSGANAPLTQGDPVVASLPTSNGSLP